jgi:acyl carrier protein
MTALPMTLTSELIVSRLAAILQSVTHQNNGPAAGLVGSTRLRDLELDSMSWLSFLVAIEESFGIEWDEGLPEDVLASLDSIAAHLLKVLRRQ